MSPDGSFTMVAGGGPAGFSGDGGPAANAQLGSASGLAVDAVGNLYIADDGNGRIRKISSDGVITTIAGNGSSTPAPASADGVMALGAPLLLTYDVALDSSGDPLIVEGINVSKISPDGALHTVTATGGMAATEDGAGNLYTAGLAIFETSPQGTVTRVAAPSTFGTPGVGGYGIGGVA